MPEINLDGCAPEPMMGYLEALGVFRLVAEQVDPTAKMSWAGGLCRLHTTLDRSQLTDFFLNNYRPTPILAPWNGGSGFYGGGSEPLDAIADSSAERLVPYRAAIAAVRRFVPKTKPKDEQKEALLIRCRAELSDEIVPWLDTCFALSEDGPSYFPLLGTGGNDGRLDFTNNFFQRLADVISFKIDAPPPEASCGWLASALFADDPDFTALGKAAVGQFNPGGIGGANGVQGDFEAGSRVNPWQYVLMIEGALLFAGSVARRLGANAASRAVFPFTVESVAVGYGSSAATEETTDGSRAELWLPLWDEPASIVEVRQLFAEGRAQIGRRQARNAVEFALAACLLGVSRGIWAFARYGFLKRNGLAFLAAPLGRVAVTPRPAARLLDDPPFAHWLERLRRACSDKEKTPARYQAALRQIDRSMFAFANRSEHGNDARYLLDVLASLGHAERTLATEGLSWLKDKQYGWKLSPLQGLSSQWLDQLDQANNGSREFRLAAALASIRSDKDNKVGPLRVFLEPVEETRYVNWSPGSTSAVWSKQPLAHNLAAVFRRRQLEAFRSGLVGVPLYSRRPARLDDLLAFLNEETDDERLHDLLWGLLLIDWSKVEKQKPARPEQRVPFEFGIPRLLVQGRFFAPHRVAFRHPQTAIDQVRIVWQISKDTKANAKPDPEVFQALMTGQEGAVEQCVDRAARRLKSGGLLVTGYRNRRRAGKPLRILSKIRPERLLAAMLFPLSNHDLERIANGVLYPPESEE
jgi:CRISPR-associated protein Csx17